MIIRSLRDIVQSDESLALIINVNTKLVTTLALLSTIRYAACPVVLIDCESKDNSWQFFSELQQKYKFYLLSLPRQCHGRMLDYVFTQLSVKQVVLVDSDIEILDEKVYRSVVDGSKDSGSFGCGFVHPGGWLSQLGCPYGWYVERMLVPFVCLRVEPMQYALRNECSFMHKTVLNDVPAVPFLSQLLHLRFRFPLLRRFPLRFLDGYRKEYFGKKPCYLEYDTGAQIYQYLLAQGYGYDTLPMAWFEKYLIHFHGVTRNALNPRGGNCQSVQASAPYVRERLRKAYAFSFPE